MLALGIMHRPLGDVDQIDDPQAAKSVFHAEIRDEGHQLKNRRHDAPAARGARGQERFFPLGQHDRQHVGERPLARRSSANKMAAAQSRSSAPPASPQQPSTRPVAFDPRTGVHDEVTRAVQDPVNLADTQDDGPAPDIGPHHSEKPHP